MGVNIVVQAGDKYNKLTIVREVKSDGARRFICKCDCGGSKNVRLNNLRSGQVKSCGCIHKKPANTTHDMSNTRLYGIWAHIKQRTGNCKGGSDISLRNYALRGIEMSDRWKKSFEEFHKWAVSNGYDDKKQIDRIDNDGNYCPENCQWVTSKVNSQNRRSSFIYRIKGDVFNSGPDAGLALNVSRCTVVNRCNSVDWPDWKREKRYKNQ